ncbi:MAG: (2Fe-2S) ferredoxin domain-containing protein [Janthinobacterium lividum]
MNHYQNHFFICTNTRQNNDRSCGRDGASELFQYAKSEYNRLGLREKGLRISSAGCLGNCKEGPIIVVYPEGKWHNYKDKNDIDTILRNFTE